MICPGPSLFICYSRPKPYFELIVKIINVTNVNFRRQFNDERDSQKINTKDGYRVKVGPQPHTDFFYIFKRGCLAREALSV